MEEMIHETLFCLNCLAICPQFALHQTSKFHNSATLHIHVWPRILLSSNIKSRFTTARPFPRYLLFDLVECQSTCIVVSKNTGLTVHVLIGLQQGLLLLIPYLDAASGAVNAPWLIYTKLLWMSHHMAHLIYCTFIDDLKSALDWATRWELYRRHLTVPHMVDCRLQ